MASKYYKNDTLRSAKKFRPRFKARIRKNKQILNKKVDTAAIIPALSGQLITKIIFFLDIFINTTNYFQNKQDWHLNSTLRIYT